MEKLTIKNGKFYRGQIEVPIEFGNREQIALLQSHIKNYEHKYLLDEEKGLIRCNVDMTIEQIDIEVTSKCLCGSDIRISDTDYGSKDLDYFDPDDIDIDIEGTYVCGCGRGYKVCWMNSTRDNRSQWVLQEINKRV